MKTKIKKFVLPMVVAFIAIAGAFASNLSKQDNTALIDRTGYIQSGVVCTQTSVTCSTIFHEQMCSDGVNPVLYDWNGTNCLMPLYRKP